MDAWFHYFDIVVHSRFAKGFYSFSFLINYSQKRVDTQKKITLTLPETLNIKLLLTVDEANNFHKTHVSGNIIAKIRQMLNTQV